MISKDSKNSKDSIKDPVHGMIDITPVEKQLIDHPFFQRLRDVSQLSGTNLIFPGAKGDRFSHCLGTMKLAGDYGNHLFPNSPNVVQLLRCAALYHDIAHGPFSHSFDSSVYSKIYPGVEKGHDLHRFKIIKHPEIVAILTTVNISPIDIIQIWNKTNKLYHSIVQGPVGADRMDFLMRDALFTGTTQFGKLFVDRIIRGSVIRDLVDGNQVLCYKEKVMDDVTNLLLSRFHMYKSVYSHKTCNASKILLQMMMDELISTNPHILTELENKFVNFTDSYIFHLIQTIGNDRSRKLLTKYQQRQLPKMIFEFTINEQIGYKVYKLLKNIKDFEEPDKVLKEIQLIASEGFFGSDLEQRLYSAAMYLLKNTSKEIIISKGITLSPLDIEGFNNLKIGVIQKIPIVNCETMTIQMCESMICLNEYLLESRFFNGLQIDSGSSVFIRVYFI